MGRGQAPKAARTIVAALRREGLAVIGVGAWEGRERDDETGKVFGPVHGVMVHHTAGEDSERTVAYTGNSTAPAPLCHALADKRGVIRMISNGRANHAGLIARNAHAAVLEENWTHPAPGPDAIDGNDAYYGLEIENLGDGGDPYPAAQYDAAVRYTAAMCRLYGWSADSALGHKEATRRKVDPSFSMRDFRRHVRACLALPAGKWQGIRAGTDQGGSMDAQEVWAYVGVNAEGDRNAMAYLIGAYNKIVDLREDVAALTGLVRGLELKVNELQAGPRG